MVTLQNVTNTQVSMPIGIISIPSGLELRFDQLKELVNEDKISAFEVLSDNNCLALHWRGLNPNESRTVPIDVTAVIPGKYYSKAGEAYLYYVKEFISYSPPLELEILPRNFIK